MKQKQLLKTLLAAVCLLVGTNAWADVTLPTPVYTQNFESASTTVGDAGSNFGIQGATLAGTGSIGTGDAQFGQYYQNMTTSESTTTSKTNYLTISTTAFSDTKSTANNAITVSFWINPYYAVSLATDNNQYGNIFVAYGDGTTVNSDLAIGLNARANLGTHCNLNYSPYSYFYDEATGGDYSWLSKGETFESSWHHVALVYSLSGSDVVYRQYIDGVLKNTYTKGNSGTGDASTYNEMTVLDQFKKFVIGGDDEIFGDHDNAFAYDEIAIYSEALSSAQVKKIIFDKTGNGTIAFYQDFSEDEDGGTATDVTKYGLMAGSNGGTYTAAINGGKYTSIVGKLGNDNANGYTEHYATIGSYGHDKLVTVSYDWMPGNGTGKKGSSNATTKLTDASGNVIMKLQLYGSDYQWKLNDNSIGTSGKNSLAPSSGSAHTVVATLNMATKKIVSLIIDGTSYGTNLDFYSGDATTLDRLYVSQTTGTNISWSNTTTLDNILVSYQEMISVTVNAKVGDTEQILDTEIFSALSGETIYCGWKKYILKDGVLYNNQQRTAGAQYTTSATSSTTVDNKYSVVDLGTSTAEYYNELGSNVAQGGNGANYMRASYGNTASASSNSTTKGSASMTLADAGVLRTGVYTFEIGNYKNRGSIIKVADREVGTTSKGSNGGTYVVTTIDNVTVYPDEAVTVINAQGTSATEEIDYFLAIRKGDATVSATITDAGAATLVSDYALDFSNVKNLQAYIATAQNGDNVTFTQVTGAVPAKTPLYLKGTTASVPVVASADAVGTNLLVAGTGEGVASEAGGKFNFILNKVGNEVGFYKAAGQTVATNRAYLSLSENPFANGAKSVNMIFSNDVTGINNIGVQAKETSVKGIYNLQGQRVSNPTKGLYVIDGKKVVIK